MLPPPFDDGGGGSGGGGGTGYAGYSGSSRIIVINTTTFDMVSPGSAFLTAIAAGGSYHGTYYSASNAAYANGSYHWAFGAFGGDQGYPQCVAYHQQRRVFASTLAQPQTVWMSQVGNFPSFGVSSPIMDDDAVKFTLNSGQLNAIRGMLSLRKLLLLTSDNEWVVGSGNSSSITPSDIQCDIQGYRGASKLVPIGVGNVALYVQSKGQIIRDIGYDFASDSFNGNDLTVMASHLVAGKSIVDWAFQQAPFSCMWAVRSDGMLLGASYLREQQVIGWHRHDTLGEFESVCVIPEGGEDVLYVSVKRTINGVEKRFVERMESRFKPDPREWFFVDCGLTFDGRNTSAVTMTMSGGTAWDNTETITVTSSSAFFVYPATTDIGDQIVFEDGNGMLYKLTLTSTSSSTVAHGYLNRVLPAGFRGVARSDWYVARNSISGLGHLEGMTVAILADGATQTPQVVTGGAITLNPPAFVANIGLPFLSDLQTLEIMDNQQGVSIGKRKSISQASIMVEDTRSIWAGRDFDHLEEHKGNAPTIYDALSVPESGTVKCNFPTPWGVDGSMCIRNVDPTPITILGLIPEVSVGG